jgi:hypothetical protein
MRNEVVRALAVPLLRESAMAAGGHGRFPASSRKNGGEGLSPAAVGGTENHSLGAVPLTAPRHMCSPLRGGTVDDTVLLGTNCLLLATSVAVKEPKLWRTGTSPWAGLSGGSNFFPRSPWGSALLWSSTPHQHRDAAEVVSSKFSCLIVWLILRPRPVLDAATKPANPARLDPYWLSWRCPSPDGIPTSHRVQGVEASPDQPKKNTGTKYTLKAYWHRCLSR